MTFFIRQTLRFNEITILGIAGDWIYAREADHILRIRTDGEVIEVLLCEEPDDLTIKRDFAFRDSLLYYVLIESVHRDASTVDKFYYVECMDVETGNIQRLSEIPLGKYEEYVSGCWLKSDGNIYFQMTSSNTLYCIDANNVLNIVSDVQMEQLSFDSDGGLYVHINGDSFAYIDSGDIAELSSSKIGEHIFSVPTDTGAEYVHFTDDGFIYNDAGEGTFFYSYKNKEALKINNDRMSAVFMAGEYIYYTTSVGEGLYRVKVDGSEWQDVSCLSNAYK